MSYQGNIDWSWTNTQACGKPVCLFFKVWDSPLILRGPLSAHACIKAANVSRSINLDLAARWIMASQAHNIAAQIEIWDNKEAAVDYAFQKEFPGSALTGGSSRSSFMAGAKPNNAEENLHKFITSPDTIWQYAQNIFQGQKTKITENDLIER